MGPESARGLTAISCQTGRLAHFRCSKQPKMTVEQIYTGCLAQGAYYIESNGEAAIIDPLREPGPYLERAARNGARIRYVLETHFHADFVSGHLELARQTGATIVYGPTAQPAFEAHIAADGEELQLGSVKIRVLHTPGHTLESSCFLLMDENGKEVALFSGDTLFIGDVGRPDLAQKVMPELTQDLLAGMLYDSLHRKLLPLADDIVVYPGHGAGSACGKNMSRETSDTLGHQKQVNYALQPGLSRAAFIARVTDGLTPPPAYFPANVLRNIGGYQPVADVLLNGLRPLPPASFKAVAEEKEALVLDVRSAEDFAAGFLPGSINIGIDGAFAPWAGALIADLEQPILLVVAEGRETETIHRLSRVGLDNVLGYLQGGFDAWKAAGRPVDGIRRIDAEDLGAWKQVHPALQLVDVRKKSEFDSEHVQGAINAPLDYINDSLALIDASVMSCFYCAGGYRSMIFASIARSRGCRNFVEIRGGFAALKKADALLTEYRCPETML